MGQRLGPRVRGDERVEKLDLHQFPSNLRWPNERMGQFLHVLESEGGAARKAPLDAPSLYAVMQRIMLDVDQTRVGLT